MKRFIALLIAALLSLAACTGGSGTPDSNSIPDGGGNDQTLESPPGGSPVYKATSVVPKPSSYSLTGGGFELKPDCRIVITAPENVDEIKENIAEYLAGVLRDSTGFAVPVLQGSEKTLDCDIEFILDGSGGFASEGYTLTVRHDKITMTAGEPAGLFYAAQTLRQMFGADIESKSVIADREWIIPCAEVADAPAYPYRGLMIDVARHFHPKETIMRQIDFASQYKINKLHLHLSDDQGWRIEIKSRPALTEIGSLTAVGGGEGGFFTQEDFKEIVAYAAKKYIEVIPEIDMPGHTNAALVSIPELNPDGIPPRVRTDIEVGYSTLQCRSEVTYVFVEDVISEIAAISPSKYFHIGGDEADATSWEDYEYFIGRVSEIVQKYGKTTIGWTPYNRAPDVLPDALIQNWIHFDGGDNGGLYQILSPAGAYLDHKYNENTKLGLSWRGFVSLHTSYDWYPSALVPNGNILGIESTLWSETIVTEADIDYMLYPRLLANAEVGWTMENDRDFIDFESRLAGQFPRLDALGVQYSREYQ